MTALDTRILERKLEFMRLALEGMRSVLQEGRKKYLANRILQAALERQIERLVEAAVDAAAHLLKEEFRKSPATYRDAFLMLGDHGVIPTDLSKKLAPAAGLRNIIVHQYEEIDPKRVFAGAQTARKIFPAYMRALRKRTGK